MTDFQSVILLRQSCRHHRRRFRHRPGGSKSFAAKGMNVVHCRPRRANGWLSAHLWLHCPKPQAKRIVSAIATDVARTSSLETLERAVVAAFRPRAFAHEQCRNPARKQSVRPAGATGIACWPSISWVSSTAPYFWPRHDCPWRGPAIIVNTGSKQGITTPPAIPPIMSPRQGSKPSPRPYSTNCATQRSARSRPTCSFRALSSRN